MKAAQRHTDFEGVSTFQPSLRVCPAPKVKLFKETTSSSVSS